MINNMYEVCVSHYYLTMSKLEQTKIKYVFFASFSLLFRSAHILGQAKKVSQLIQIAHFFRLKSECCVVFCGVVTTAAFRRRLSCGFLSNDK